MSRFFAHPDISLAETIDKEVYADIQWLASKGLIIFIDYCQIFWGRYLLQVSRYLYFDILKNENNMVFNHIRILSPLCMWLVLAIYPLTFFAQNPTYPPKDEAYLDASLAAFVKDLLQAIDSRDKHFINDALDFNVVASLDSKGGLDDFKATWSPENDSSLMWPLMKRVIQLGGVFLKDSADQTGRYQFVFPYVYDMPLDIEDDYFNIGVVTGKNVNLRSGPDTASPIKSKLAYDVVWYVQDDLAGKTMSGTNPYGDPEWYLVETYDKAQRGWVNWKYLYSPTGPRMFLYQTKKGEWKISAFVSGD